MGFFLALAPVWAGDEGNLLLNGGFEDWAVATQLRPNAANFENGEVPSKWMASVGIDAEVETRPLVARDGVVKHDGSYSIRLEALDEAPFGLGIRAKDDQWHPSPIQINSETKYVVRGWYKGENLAASVRGKFFRPFVIVGGGGDFFGGDNNNRNVGRFLGEMGTSDWTPFEFEFDTSPDEVSLWFGVSIEGSGKIWLDGLEIVPLSAQNP